VYEATKIAIDAGYRHIDEAWIYANEDEVGRALEEKFAAGAVKREDVCALSLFPRYASKECPSFTFPTPPPPPQLSPQSCGTTSTAPSS